MRKNIGAWRRLGRLIHLRLIVPLKRSRHSPEFTARGTAIGLFWAFTPLVGIQMHLVFLTWLCMRPTRWRFNLLVGVAWTWVTNVLTMWPCYYVFYVTGRLMLGDWHLDFAYHDVVEGLKSAFLAGDDFLSSVGHVIKALLADTGLPLLLGCVPYAIGFGWGGYLWSVAYLRRRQARRLGALGERAQPVAGGVR
ncbi:MAG: DUF2062 domain-containing protein [Defluviicoccus sp.]|nr:DUF2062 domain-containing protein [Defluviicoccus sp.]MDG4591990.1 DUF2062 domain-containing protein [Defluviicoccus sp.]MDS4012314.1 DUF2062 domain-containing protein [Defluviicoccus sp.]